MIAAVSSQVPGQPCARTNSLRRVMHVACERGRHPVFSDAIRHHPCADESRWHAARALHAWRGEGGRAVCAFATPYAEVVAAVEALEEEALEEETLNRPAAWSTSTSLIWGTVAGNTGDYHAEHGAIMRRWLAGVSPSDCNRGEGQAPRSPLARTRKRWRKLQQPQQPRGRAQRSVRPTRSPGSPRHG